MKIIYDKKEKVWKEEGATLRHSTRKQFKVEAERVESFIENLSDEVFTYIDRSTWYFKNKNKCVALLQNLLTGGYDISSKNDYSTIVIKEWYSHKMRTKYIHAISFGYNDRKNMYKVTVFSDEKRINTYNRNIKYGSKIHPIKFIPNYQ